MDINGHKVNINKLSSEDKILFKYIKSVIQRWSNNSSGFESPTRWCQRSRKSATATTTFTGVNYEFGVNYSLRGISSSSRRGIIRERPLFSYLDGRCSRHLFRICF